MSTCSCNYIILANRIGDVVVSVLTSSAVDRGFEPRPVKPKTKNLVCVASLLSTHHIKKKEQRLVGSESE
jgi:hypothetical protein